MLSGSDMLIAKQSGYYGEDFDISRNVGVYTCERLIREFHKYTKDLQISEIDPKTVALSEAVTRYIKKNSGRQRYSRLKELDNRPLKDKPALVLPGVGYLWSEKDAAKVWPFLLDCRNDIARTDPDMTVAANALLVNYTKRRPFISLITKNQDYEVDTAQYDVDLMHLYRDCFYYFTGLALVESDPFSWGVKNKKDTSMGYPYETVDGDPIDPEQSSWSLTRDGKTPLSKASLLVDRSEIKRQFRERDDGCRRKLDLQMEFISREGGVKGITPANVGTLVENDMVTVANPAFRENNPDIAKDDRPKLKLGDNLFGKNRFFSCFVPENGDPFATSLGPSAKLGRVLTGTLVKEKLNELLQFNEWTKRAWYGYDENQRGIYPTNNMMHTNGTFLARGTLSKVEHSEVGHPSTSPEVIRRWRETGEWLTSNGYDTDVCVGDCTNAEVTVTSNEIFKNLVPEAILPYLEMTAFTVSPCGTGFRVEPYAYNSAVWYTTWFHVLKGNFENIRIQLEKLRRIGVTLDPKWLRQLMVSYCAVMFYHENDREAFLRRLPATVDEQPTILKLTADGSYVFVPNLGTDDITSRRGWKKGCKPLTLDDSDVAHFKKSMLNVESCQLANSFGMDQTVVDLKEGVSNTIRAVFTGERMGFYARDIFSTWIRLEMSPYKDIFEFNLKKHFGHLCPDVGIAAYAREAQLFPTWLKATGVQGITSVFNEYSPKDRLIIGELVGPMGMSAQELRERDTSVSAEACEKFKSKLLHYFYGGMNGVKESIYASL